MELVMATDAKFMLGSIDTLMDEASKAVKGNVDATIHGRYFGDQLLVDEELFLRAIAVKYTARRLWREVQMLKDTGIVVAHSGEPIRSEQELALLLVGHYAPADCEADLEEKLLILYA